MGMPIAYDIRVIFPGLPQVSSYFAFQMDSQYLPIWNRAIYMQQSFVRRTFDKYFRENFKLDNASPKNCTNTINQGRRTHALGTISYNHPRDFHISRTVPLMERQGAQFKGGATYLVREPINSWCLY
jgi:hypothetical protein